MAALAATFTNSLCAADTDLRIREVMAGANGNRKVQFIIIEQQRGQNLWGPQAGETESREMLVFFDGAGRETGKFKFNKNPATGAALQTLIATDEFARLPGAPIPDVIIPPMLTPNSGRVCLRNNPANGRAPAQNDCVSYTNLPIVNAVSLHRTPDSRGTANFLSSSSLAIPITDLVTQGANLFNNETFNGNGRTCATCHDANDNFRLSPAKVQSRFATLASPTFSFDPLFIGEFKPSSFDAGFDFNLNTLVLTAEVTTPSPCTGELSGIITSENGARGKVLTRVSPTTYLIYGGTNPAMTGVVTDGTCSGTVSSITAGDLAVVSNSEVRGLEDPKLMRVSSAPFGFPQGRGLILENIDDFSNPPVFRKSPHLLNLNRTGPFGFSGDVADLQTFSTKAVIQHFPRTLARNSSGPNPDFRLPTQDELIALEAFMRAQEFPSGDDPNKFDLDRFATTSAQRTGRAQFFGTPSSPNCSSCHGGPLLSQTTISIQGKPIGVNASFNTGASNVSATGDNLSCEPSTTVIGPCNSREFSVPPLFNANNLGPFFHNASESTLANAVNFYASFTFAVSPANDALTAQNVFINAGTLISSFLAGLTPRPYTLTTGPIRFGVQATSGGPTAAQSITITNTGSATLTFGTTACSLTGTDASQFAITSCPLISSSLAAGQSAIVLVTFDPSSTGLKRATLEINATVPSGVDLFGVGDTLPAAPTLSSIAGTSGTADGGDTITLTGTNFASGAVVTIGGVRAGFVNIVSATSISARTGAHAAGTVDVVVTNPDGQSVTLTNGFSYTVPAALSLGPISPMSGSSLGSSITINGAGFRAGATVKVGGIPATNVSVVTSTMLTATTGGHAPGSADACVTNPNGEQVCAANVFTFISAPAPVITSVTPASGSYLGGTNVTIQGAGFSNGASVTFGGSSALIITLTATRITARTVSHLPGIVDVVVTNDDGQSSTKANAFTYLPPSITSISPVSGSTVGGTSVFISGDGFLTGATVTFGGTPATNVSVSNSFISASTPAHVAGTVSVVVTNLDGQTAALNGGFNYVLPTISSTFPGSGSTAGGTSVQISGSGFGPGATVTFGGVAASVTSSNETFISATAPAHAAGSVSLVVTNVNGTTATRNNAFTYVLPTISSINPSVGATAGGTRVSISGSGFAVGATVTFAGLPATNLSISDSFITANVPAHAAGSVNVVVTNPDASTVTSNNAFTYILPSISSVSPTTGATVGGTSISINGAGFAQGATLTFGGAAATNLSISDTFMFATTPSHAAGAVDVVVTNPDNAAGTKVAGFTFAAPTLVSISPTSGRTGGGTSVTMSGTNFAQGVVVTFGGVPATNVSRSGETFMFATTPAHAAGIVDVVVTNPDGSAVTKPNAFTYVLPTINSISPITGTTNGGTSVFISGTGFNQGAKVTFGGIIATSVSVGETSITATTPPHAVGSVDVAITNPDGASAISANAFTYALPMISSVSPTSGTTAGGTFVNMFGSGFAQGLTVTFGGVPATNVSSSDSFISLRTPPHSAGAVNITVTNPDGSSVMKTGGFTYVLPTISSVNPTSGNTGGGTFMNISGGGFGQGLTLTFGGVAATNVSVSDTFISASTPPHAAGVVNVVVTNTDGSSVTATNAFTYVLPSITSVNPTSGNTGGGTFVSISGVGFGQAATVTFGGVAATNVFVSENSISATTAAHAAGFVNVVVANPNGATSTLTNGFQYILPTMSAVSPTSGGSNGGTFFSITGNGLAQGATVTFGGVAATNTFFNGNETSISGFTPLHAPGTVDVVVTNPNGAIATLTNGFTYLPSVTISSVSPTSGTSLGGTSITVSGSGFSTGATVKTGGVAATSVVVVSSNTITAVTGPHPAGFVEVLVTNTNGMNGTLANAFQYVAATPPHVTEIAPPSGSSLGGTSLTITGSAFFQGATVNIGGAPATNVSFVNAGTLTAVSPAHVAGLVSVEVANVDGQTNTLTNSFTYVAAPAPTITAIIPPSGSTLGGTPVTIVGVGLGNGVGVTIGGQAATNVTFVNSTTVMATTAARTAAVVDVLVTNPDSQTANLASAFTYTSTPSNDNFANRFTVVGAGSITASGSNVGATAEPNEPFDQLGVGNGTPSVWWTWKATCSFSVTAPNPFISTSGSSFDTALGVFTGSSLASLTLFASDDDSGQNLNSQIPSASLGPSTLNILAGTVFHIRVRSFSTNVGNVVVHINSPCGITGVSPPSGPVIGGTNVTISGSGFTNGAAVTFGGVTASAVTVVNSSTITATTGAHGSAVVDVVVTTPNQPTATLSNGFTYGDGLRRARGQITSQ